MVRQKQIRFAALRTMDNVVDGRRCAPDWFVQAFGVDTTVVLELGCGRGEYTLSLARSRPGTGVLGVDRNGSRLWKGAGQALAEGLTNAMFLCASIEYLEDHVPPNRVREIWLPFPDPLPKNRQARHRLVSPAFLERYRRVLKPGGAVHLTTDDSNLVGFAEHAVHVAGGRMLEGADDVAAGDGLPEVRTAYETRYRGEGRTIYHRTFCLD